MDAADSIRGWKDTGLGRLFGAAREQYREMLEGTGTVGHREREGTLLQKLVRHAQREQPLDLLSPFEGVDTIAGGVWRPRDGADDALLLLRFDKGTLDLPLHSHDHSDRCICVLAGSGVFHWLTPQDHSREIPVRIGDQLGFNRGVVHTFQTPVQGLLLLSYHQPFVALDAPRQWTRYRALREPHVEIPAFGRHGFGHVARHMKWVRHVRPDVPFFPG